MSPDISALVAKILQFRDARDWKRFHTLKNLVSATAVEAAELLELTQWKTTEELEAVRNNPELLAQLDNEVADVFIYLLLICEKLAVDPIAAARRKMAENEKRYPIEKSRGSATKYSQL
jgi:NTP pyrophosphatase (non-canonical NTP hydrolase)